NFVSTIHTGAHNLEKNRAASPATRTRWRAHAPRYSRLFHPPILHTPPQPCPRQSHSLRLPYWSSPRAASNPEPRADRDQLQRSGSGRRRRAAATRQKGTSMQGSFLCFPEAPPTARRAPASAPNTRTQSCGRGCPLSFRGFQGNSQPLENSRRPPAHPPPPPRVPPTINSLPPSRHSEIGRA